jgi:hypothetical protein
VADSRLNILIAAKNNASAGIKQVEGDLKGLDGAARSASAGLAGIGAAAGIAGIVAMSGALQDLARDAAMADMVAESFEGVAASVGASADELLESVRRASRGTIAEADLILSANRAILLGVADSTTEMAGLMEAALARGRAMGLSDTEAFSKMVTGIGRESPLILDDLGIKDATTAFDIYAESIGTTTDKLDNAERKQALFNYVMRETIPLIEAQAAAGETMNDKWERMDASIANLKVSAGGLLNDVFIPYVTILGDVAAAFTGLSESMSGDAASGASAGWMALRAALLPVTLPMELANAYMGLKDEVAESGAAAETTSYAAEALAAAEHEAEFGADRLAASLAMLAGEQGAAAGAADAHTAALDVLNVAAQQAKRAIDSIAAGAMGKVGAAGAVEMAEDLNTELGAQATLWQDMGYDANEIANVLIPGWVSGQRDITRESLKTGSAVEKVNKEYEELLGKIEGILSGSLDPGVGVDPDKILGEMGLRPDALNEAARRLADVAVNGFDSPWVDYLKDEFPALWAQYFSGAMDGGNLQAQAAQLLKNFQDGLVPEMIDRDKAKDLVRRLITGEQNMAALAGEIAAELAAEMGISTGAALSAAKSALGVGGEGGGGAGGDAANAFDSGMAQGLSQANTGSNYVSQLAAQMRASFKLISSAGSDAGAQFAAGFATGSANIPAQFINMLVNMITPGVEAALGRRQTQTGAVP